MKGSLFTRINSGQATDCNLSRVGFIVLSSKKKKNLIAVLKFMANIKGDMQEA